MSKLKIVQNLKELRELITHCKTTRYCSHDYETTGLKYHSQDELPLMMGVSFQPGSAWVIPLAHKESCFKGTWEKILLEFSKEVLEDRDIVKVAWNFKFEKKWHTKNNIKMAGRCFDAMLAKYCLDEERPHGLKDFVRSMFPKYANYELKVKGQKWGDIPLNTLAIYCGLDCDLTLRGMIIMEKKLIRGGFYTLFRNLLMMASWVLSESEYRGILIDKPYLESLIKDYKQKITEVEEKLRNTPSLLKYERKYKKKHLRTLLNKVRLEIEAIREEDAKNAATLIRNREKKIKSFLEGNFSKKDSYEEINFSSPKQLISFLYIEKFGLNLPILKYTKNKNTKQNSTNPSTDEEVLEKLKTMDKSGFMENLLEYRGLTKLFSTYVEGMYPLLDSRDKVHANFKIHGTVTGRLSCDEPNLQNIPRGCIRGDQQIITNKGLIAIGDLIPKNRGTNDIGDLNLKALTHKGNWENITHGVNKGEQSMFEVVLENGAIIVCTLEHKFLIGKNKWKTLKEIMDQGITHLIIQ